MKPTKRFVEGKWRLVLADGTMGSTCPPPTDEERRAQENEEQRLKYQAEADETGKEVWWRGERFVPSWNKDLVSAENPRPSLLPGQKVYKVLTQRDEWFKGKFSPEKLEEAVNHYAAEGWQIVGVTTTDVASFWGSFLPKGGGAVRQEIVVFMEKAAE
jgi:hypothetical protein